MSDEIPEVLTTGDVVRLCQVAPRTAAKWIDSGALPGYRLPGSRDRRVRREQFLQFVRVNQMAIVAAPDGVRPELPLQGAKGTGVRISDDQQRAVLSLIASHRRAAQAIAEMRLRIEDIERLLCLRIQGEPE